MQKIESVSSNPTMYPSRFGLAAVSLGFITPEQLREAMLEQLNTNLETNVHRLIGEILHEKGWMTLEQVETTLEKME
ncbi:MAG TPA: hypothetical protein VJ974_03460 [Geopsychrobacteraceae bacterium]|nr:hypothetical protein [Geopsychrobacteraceae bacterium]